MSQLPGGRLAAAARIRAERFGQRPRADPVDLGAERQRSPHGVQMRVDEPRDDRAAVELDDARGRTREAANLRRAAYAQDLAVANRERFVQRRLRVHGDDLAVEQHEIGRLRGRLAAGSEPYREQRAAQHRVLFRCAMPRDHERSPAGCCMP